MREALCKYALVVVFAVLLAVVLASCSGVQVVTVCVPVDSITVSDTLVVVHKTDCY